MFADFAIEANGGGIECSEPLLRALDDPRRRTALAVLSDLRESIPEAELAERVAAVEGLDDESVRRLLHHEDLPMLAAADLVERTPAGVSLPEPLRDDVETLLDRVDRLPAGAWDLLTTLLSDPLRRAVAATLDREGPGSTVHVERLAATLADRAGPHRTRDDVATELHHVHLPQLAETDLLSYHADPGVVEYRGVSVVSKGDPVSLTLAAVTDFQRELRERA